METVEALKKKIKCAEDLRSIVKTMKALAAVSIRQYEKAAESLAEYNRTVEMGLQIAMRNKPEEVVMAKPGPSRYLGAIIFGSDQGMCGPFNEQVVSYAIDKMRGLGINRKNRILWAVGVRAVASLEEAGEVVNEYFSVPGSAAGIAPVVREILMKIERWRAREKLDQVILFYNKLVSVSSYRACALHLLPVDIDWVLKLEKRAWPSRVLPTFTMSWKPLVSSLIRQYFFVSLYRAFAESQASENVSRLSSMQGAERNIEDRLKELTAQFHRVRQSSIDEELFDIVGGFEVLTEKEV